MNVVYALDTLPKSIFLAGPTPRDPLVPSWRPQALELLEGLGFDGTVYVPEIASYQQHDEYDHQIQWEWDAISRSSVVAFWVPRDLEHMPAFTTNVEFGLTVAHRKVILAYPEGAPKMTYLQRLAATFDVPVFNSLEALLRAAVQRV